jgi:hypothetical protein
VLPRAIRENRDLIAALKEITVSPLAQAYEAEADKPGTAAERTRYCLDIARELYFLEVRDALYARSSGGPYPDSPPDRSKIRSMEPGSKESGYSLGDSLRFWSAVKRIQTFIEHYTEGRFPEARQALASME